METIKTRFVEFVSYFFILLFCYASISKMMDFENFQIQLGQSPILSSYTSIVSYGILAIELLVSVILIFEKTRRLGLYCCFVLMVLFSLYIYIILNYSESVPCSCGGILEKMGWRTHLIFNIVTVILASCAIIIDAGEQRKNVVKSLIVQLILVILSFAGILILFQRSEYTGRKENNFTRRFLEHPISEDKHFNLEYNSYYFAGITSDSVYLGNSTTPFLLTSIDIGLTKTIDKKVIPDHYDFSFKRAKIQINAPYYYLYDGTVPIIYKGLIGQQKVSTHSKSQAFFSQLINIDQESFAFSTYHAPLKIQSLGLLFPEKEKHLQLKPNLLKKIKDGVFDTDGELHYDKKNKSLVYIHTYKNQFLVFDKSFNIKGDFKTIDTITHPQIEVGMLSDGRRKMKKPPFKVNLTSTVQNGLLFNQSNLIGKHENHARWEKSAIIDVYSTDEQNYIGSFYIPKPKEIKTIQMEVNGNYLFVLIGNEIVRYRFAQNISKHFRKGKAENLDKE